jgi:hypothetical protein
LRTLTDGSKGADVMRLQHRLAELNFPPGEIDGRFGADLQQAVWASKALVLGISYRRLADDTENSNVDPALWQLLSEPITISPRHLDKANRTHVEIYLALQVLIVFVNNAPELVTHVSSGVPNGEPLRSSCDQTTQGAGTSDSARPATTESPARTGTPWGVFSVSSKLAGYRPSDLGGEFNPAFFYRDLSIYGAREVPLVPATCGSIRMTVGISTVFAHLVHKGDPVYIWGYDDEEPTVSQRPNATSASSFSS